MPKFNYVYVPFTIALLSACGGGGGDDAPLIYGEDITIPASGGATDPAIGVSKFEEIGQAFEALGDALDAGTYTAPTARPTGTVEMTGYMALNQPGVDDTVTVGNMSISAAFDSNTITGSASGFRTFDTTDFPASIDDDLTGTLTISGTNVGNGFSANAAGDLTNTTGTVSIDVNMSGDLFDVEGAPTYVGTISDNGTTAGGNPVPLEGDFVAF